MCGIASLWDPTITVPERARLAGRMSAALVHRGPDAGGAWDANDESIPLAIRHRRLAIRGLGEQGAQPMLGATSVLSFNGELFGVESLRREFLARGVVFRGTSDTEILLHALEHWGVPGALNRLRGQFAFVWWSHREHRLYLVRDRVGIRPLYWSRAGAKLAVASEQKALLLLPWVDAAPAIDPMLRFLSMGRTDDVPFDTMLGNVRSLPPGHWASWDGSEFRVSRYHRIDESPPPSSIEELRRELVRAVDEQLVSDVPIGATVSGGLDSSAVVALADRARLSRGDSTTLHLFAYHDLRAEQDETLFQKEVIHAVRSPSETHWVSSSPEALASRFDHYVNHQEEPYGDVSSYAEFCLAEEAHANGVKVLLGGLGGDEVFVGYVSFFGPLVLDLLRKGDFAALRQVARIAPDVFGKPGAAWVPFAAAAYHALPARLRNMWSALRNARSAGLQLKDVINGGADAWRTWHRHDGSDHTNAALRGALESWSIPRYLLHSDRMVLAHGVEGRVPLLDDGVIRAAFGIPPSARLGPYGLKASLRNAIGDQLPKAVVERRWKLGFHAPVNAYVQALDEPLRTGHRFTCDILGGGPAWDELPSSGRWNWGVLGCYLAWARRQQAV